MAERIASWLDDALRTGASIIGTLPAALLGAMCLARFLPFEAELRFVVGFTLAIPLWVAAICLVVLATTARRAWISCGALALILAGLALVRQ